MEIQNFAEQYRTETDEELLRLALVPEQLTPEANAALKDELARRSIHGSHHLSAFCEQETQRQTEQARDPGKLFFTSFYGIGRSRFGKAKRIYDSVTGMERFTTTVFIILFFFPLIPTGTYLVERKRQFFSDQPIFLEKLPLDWEQVLKVWVVASGSLLALIWVFKLLPRLLYRP
jgi:hypothetical protein